jgi:hypothetical protein
VNLGRSRLFGAVACALLLTGFSLAFGTAGADSSTVQITAQGWWTKTQNKSLPSPAPPPPNVKPGQLNVQGGPNGAVSVAAFKATLGPNDTNPTLTLTVASDTGGSSAVLLACLTGSAWTAVENGDYADSPHVDTTKCVNGHRVDDGKTVTVPLGALQFGTSLDVVLVSGTDPTLPAGANGSTFQFVFEKIAPTAIATTSGGSGAAPPPLSSPAFGSFGASGAGAGGTAGTHAVVAPPSGASVVPTPAIPADKAGQTATSPVQQAATAPQVAINATDSESGRTRTLGILVLLAGTALGLWAWRSDNLARIDAATASATGMADEKDARGLGRFVRPRTGQPPALT